MAIQLLESSLIFSLAQYLKTRTFVILENVGASELWQSSVGIHLTFFSITFYGWISQDSNC